MTTSNWLTRTTPERFHGFVAGQPGADECWIWTGKLATTGYGRFWDGTRNTYAHRYSYELFVGPIPDGLVIDHLCRNRACCNPSHLEAVTHAENVRRGLRGRLITHCPQAHEYTEANTIRGNGRRGCRECKRIRDRKSRAARTASLPPSKRRPVLQPADIPVIRAMRAQGMSLRAIAREIGCSTPTIHRVVRGSTWSHL